MALQFSSSTNYSQHIQANFEPEVNDLEQYFELEKCIQWVESGNFCKICLQFPDHYLKYAYSVQNTLKNRTGRKYFILADTAYQSCCIDFVAAEHVNANAVIHFGPKCVSKVEEKLPCLFISEKKYFEACKLKEAIERDNLVGATILLDMPYLHMKENVSNCFGGSTKVFSLDEKQYYDKSNNLVYVGLSQISAINLKFATKCPNFYIYDPSSGNLSEFNQEMKVLKLRNFYSEKIKDSHVFGLVVGTLAVENYLEVLERIKTLLKTHSKNYYIISVGKPTVPKLANFLEVDVFVLIACPMNQLYDSRDFHKPIVTPCDIEIALNRTRDTFSYDYNAFERGDILPPDDTDVSLLSNRIRNGDSNEKAGLPDDGNSSREIATQDLRVSEISGAGFLATRTWRGLEPKLGETPAELATSGRKGIASKYENEECKGKD